MITLPLTVVEYHVLELPEAPAELSTAINSLSAEGWVFRSVMETDPPALLLERTIGARVLQIQPGVVMG